MAGPSAFQPLIVRLRHIESPVSQGKAGQDQKIEHHRRQQATQQDDCHGTFDLTTRLIHPDRERQYTECCDEKS
jgi:hypothetical protein